eukprot:sb/3469742/
MADSSDEDVAQRPAKIAKKSSSDKRLIVVLENASLETIKVGKVFKLLTADKQKNAKDAKSVARPDITHQCLLMLLDSPLNRAGKLQVYIHTERNVLIEVNPATRIPRTFDRFCGLMVQLLHKLSIHAADGPNKLLKVIKNPVSDYFPVGCRKYCMTFNAPRCVRPKELVTDEPVVMVIGAQAHGAVNVDYTEENIGISNYPLSAALTCTKLCDAFEESWGIL